MLKLFSRRNFINSVFSCCGAVLVACNPKKSVQENTSNSKPGDPCNDFSGVSESELNKRNTLGYVKEAPVPDKQCNVCKLYLPPKKNERCGGCMLFKGPVEGNGSCTYWAPLV
jgi:hypothetical protein